MEQKSGHGSRQILATTFFWVVTPCELVDISVSEKCTVSVFRAILQIFVAKGKEM
jgi:hypothetical protein